LNDGELRECREICQSHVMQINELLLKRAKPSQAGIRFRKRKSS
jgi:hypothetical protein